MAEAVTNSLQFLTSADVNALVRYLRRVKAQPSEPKSEVSVPPLQSASAEEADDSRDSLGKQLFSRPTAPGVICGMVRVGNPPTLPSLAAGQSMIRRAAM
jgi:hypothetical protein